MNSKLVILAFLLGMVFYAPAQERSVSAFNPKYVNWYNLDLKENGVPGISADKAYREILNGLTPKKTIIVAVLDGGVDIRDEDLKGRIWVNEKEVPGNGTDDDHNGYVDDISGWNYLGNSKGQNILYETMEYTRIYRQGAGSKDYKLAKKLYETELSKQQEMKKNLEHFDRLYQGSLKIIKRKTGIEVHSAEDLKNLSIPDDTVGAAVDFLRSRYNMGFREKMYEEMKKNNWLSLQRFLNLEYDPRKRIVGDDPEDINDTHYGNADVIGPDATHGTCTAGIIAAIRDNGPGINGIASNVKIMVLRMAIRGDERDKDVALAIRYAVDNGASIINMSFGKDISPQRKFVEEAIRYADRHNVLIVHSAGNTAENMDKKTIFPTSRYLDKTRASNFITVGASGCSALDSLACKFSNYGSKYVDLFAPGENIVALDTSNVFEIHSGTSQAAPVVTGVAAVLLSYFPDLTPGQVITILRESSLKFPDLKVHIPSLTDKDRKLVRFDKLSGSGGIVNLYNAIKYAQQMKGKQE